MQDVWDRCVARFSQMTDALGKSIDPEIFEVVIALNVLDIPTVMSCGGHTDDGRGLLLPWVDIEPADPSLNHLKQEEQQLIESAKQMHQHITCLRQDHVEMAQLKEAQRKAGEVYEQLHVVQREIRMIQAALRTHLADYLALFYAERQVPFDRRLVLSGLDRTRLQSQGALDFYLAAPVSVQQQKLQEYREEMAAFATFLKTLYIKPVLFDRP